jgi:hypothetical protein
MEAKDTPILEIARGDVSGSRILDELSKGLATGTISRRRALKLAGAAVLGSTGLLALFPAPAGAVSDRACRGEPAINNRRCPTNRCRGNPDCNCARTVNGDRRCVNVNAQCPTRDECDRNRDCRRGEVCVKVGGCCTNPDLNVCLSLC